MSTEAKPRLPWRMRASSRGFLIMVVIGVLAVMLAVCVGFLSYTRGEVNAVATIRDKNDAADIMESARDYTLACIMADTMSGSAMSPSKTVSMADNGNWWYRPYQKGLGEALRQWWGEGAVRSYMANAARQETQWIYLPGDFFAEGGVRARVMVQVMDANSVINVNDWNEDCAPTQCQMAHIVMGAYGDTPLDRYRAFRDTGLTGFNGSGYSRWSPLRYHEAWRVASRTTRYLDWVNNYVQGSSTAYSKDNMAGDYWLTTNSCWMGLYGVDMAGIKAIMSSDGVPMNDQGRLPSSASTFTQYGCTFYMPPDLPAGPNTWRFSDSTGVPGGYGNRYYDNGALGWGVSGFGLMGYTDPDTGRSPVNVNTCYNSGEQLPIESYGSYAVRRTHTMEGVFNIESLRRMMIIGEYQVDHDNDAATPLEKLSDLTGSPDYFVTKMSTWTDAQKAVAWQKHEMLRTKMAYRYQEQLCRYFTGTYDAVNSSYGNTVSRRFPPFSSTVKQTFTSAYPAISVSNNCANNDYSATRFNASLTSFRSQTSSDLASMATADDYVVFDASDNPTNCAQGQIDRRTASAVLDNIVPGKATMFSLDPLSEIRDWELAREEDTDDPFDVYGRWDYTTGSRSAMIPAMAYAGNVHLDHNGAGQNVMPKGRDVAGLNAPPGPYDRMGVDDPHLPAAWDVSKSGANTAVAYRQKICPDGDAFSTELTTTTTNFIMIVNIQLVDKKTVDANPTDPTKHRDLFWNSWGMVVEIAPDVINESTPFEYYETEKPKLYKTATQSSFNGMDFRCPTLIATGKGDGTLGTPYIQTNSYTYVKDWKADMRGITPADASSFYSGANQVQRHIRVRSIWSLNQGIMR
ncbi:MAG: hypothetical protein KIS92_16310 [Planctomycetota bacterium]|nr:hypothetical protein [Planctomycetota bacterium]